MATEVRQPDDDIDTGDWTTAPLWSKLDEGSGSPDGVYVVCPNNKASTGECAVQNPSNFGTYTGVEIKVRVRKDAAGGNQRGLDGDIRIGGNLQGQKTFQADLTEIFVQYVQSWTGLSFTQTEMDSLQVSFTSTGTTGGAPSGRREVHVDYVELVLTYEPQAQEFVYSGSVPALALVSCLLGGGMVYGGGLQLDSVPSYASAMDIVHVGDLAVVAIPSHTSGMAKGYEGSIPLVSLCSHDTVLGKGYDGSTALVAVPCAAYSLEGLAEFVYSGQAQMIALAAYTSTLQKAYEGQGAVITMPSYSSAVDQRYDGSVALLAAPNYASALGATYEGTIAVTVSPAYLSKIDIAYGGTLPVQAVPSYVAIIDRSYDGLAIALALPIAAYSLFGQEEFLYSGRVDAALVSTYLSRLEKSYAGNLPVFLLCNASFSGGQLMEPIRILVADERPFDFIADERPMWFTVKARRFDFDARQRSFDYEVEDRSHG